MPACPSHAAAVDAGRTARDGAAVELGRAGEDKVMFDRLKAPFAPDRISWRVGPTNKDKSKGMALAYIDARDVMERLDEVCGPAGWQCRYPHANGKTVCEIGIRSGDEWIWKADGAGDTDMEAQKGALSDAFKRAAVRWGIGRYLYDVQSPWVAIEAFGKSFRIAEGEHRKLQALLMKSVAPSRADADRPSVSSPPGTDVQSLAVRLISEMTRITTLRGLKSWAANEAGEIDGLSDNDKSIVRDRYSQHLKSLKDAADLPITAAG